MTQLSIRLDSPLDQFVEEQVRSGAYDDAEAVVRAALDRLRNDDVARTERFRSKVQLGLDQLEAGLGVEVDHVDEWVAKIAPLPGDE